MKASSKQKIILRGLGNAWHNLCVFVRYEGLWRALPHAVGVLRKHGVNAFSPSTANTASRTSGGRPYADWISRYETANEVGISRMKADFDSACFMAPFPDYK
jgi:hypothetical protein